MCPRRHTSSLMSMACDAIPIVVRATTLTRVPPSTARIAQHNARATGHPVFIVGCWPATTTADGVHSIGLMSHPACGEAHREARYRNRHARARLARFQPTWASVDALTHAALTGESTNSNNNNHGVGMRRMPAGRRSPQEFPPAILPNCSTISSTNNNRGCIALVVDPDVLLFKHTVKRACEYYRAYQYDAVLLFAPPRGRFTSLQEALDESKKALGASSSSSSSSSAAGSVDPAAAAYLESNAPLLDLMGNRHVSFLSVHALSALSTLTTEIAPTYDLDKGMDKQGSHTHCSSAPQCHSLTAALPFLSLFVCCLQEWTCCYRIYYRREAYRYCGCWMAAALTFTNTARHRACRSVYRISPHHQPHSGAADRLITSRRLHAAHAISPHYSQHPHHHLHFHPLPWPRRHLRFHPLPLPCGIPFYT